jgi:hypothetical protein
MRPIPKVLLKDTIQYYEFISEGRYEASFKAPIKISNVLINYTKAVIKSVPANQQTSMKGTMFVDAINSSPFFEMKYGSKIIDASGREFFVAAVKPIQAFTLHHYEVDLS